MKRSRKIVQLSLISIGLFLILVTYFLYPKIIENKFIKEETTKDKMLNTGSDNINMLLHRRRHLSYQKNPTLFL